MNRNNCIPTLFSLLLFIFYSINGNAESNSSKDKSYREKIQQLQQAALEVLQTDSAAVLRYSHEMLEIAQQNNDSIDIGNAFFLMGEAYYYTENYREATKYYLSSQPFIAQAGDTIKLIEIYNSLGLCQLYQQQFDEATRFYYTGLRLAQQINDEEQTAYIYSNLAVIFSRIKNYKQAIEQYHKALAINIKLNNSLHIASSSNGLGSTFYLLEKYDSAQIYFQKALKYFRQTNDLEHEAIVLNNIANIHANGNDSLVKAISYYTKAIEVFEKLDNKLNMAYSYEGMGGVYLKMKNYAKAKETYMKGLRMMERTEPDYSILQSYYYSLSSLYEETGDYQQALKYARIESLYGDSLFNENKINQIATLEKQFDTEKKEAEINQLKIEQKLNLAQRANDRYIRISGTIMLFLLIVALFYVWLRFLDKKKASEILRLKNEQISQSEEELRNLNAAKNKFFSIIAHDLKSPFHITMGYSQLLNNGYDSLTDSDRKKYVSTIYKSTQTIFGLLSNLLDWSRSQTNKVTFNPMDIEFSLICDNVISLLGEIATKKQVQIETQFDKELLVYADPVMLETILRNLTSNAIKYSYAGGKIQIQAQASDDSFVLKVKDNGTGMSVSMMENLFRIDSKVKQKGTQNEEGSGIGLILCKELVNRHDGQIFATNNGEQGTCFTVSIPQPTKIS